MELLLARLRGGRPSKTQVFAPELIVRGSTTEAQRGGAFD